MKSITLLIICSIAFCACDHRVATKTITVDESFPMAKTIPYKTVSGLTLELDLYTPEEQKAAFPLLIWVHGGAWMRGSKDDFMKQNTNLAKGLLAKGYAVASLNYRLSQQAIFPAQAQDINDAINYLVDQSKKLNLHTDNIVVMGRSAGAHLATLIASSNNDVDSNFYSSENHPRYSIAGVVNFFGPSDLEELRGNSGKVDHDAPDAAEAKLLGESPRERPDLARWASPTNYVDSETPPMILFHGSSDEVVPLSQSQHLKTVLDKAGVSNELHVAEGARHGDRVFDSEPYVEKAISFVENIFTK